MPRYVAISAAVLLGATAGTAWYLSQGTTRSDLQAVGQDKATTSLFVSNSDSAQQAEEQAPEVDLSPVPEKILKFTPPGMGGRTYEIALNEVYVKDSKGVGRSLALNPPATAATLRTRIHELRDKGQVSPVCYPLDLARNEHTRALLTEDFTIKLAEGHEKLPELPAGVRVKEFPEYAPGYVVLTAQDPFSALEAAQTLAAKESVEESVPQLAILANKLAMPNDPYIDEMWHLLSNTNGEYGINVEDVWNYGGLTGIRGKGVRLGIVDDSVEITHLDLFPHVDLALCKDFNDGDDDPSPVLIDDNHGTACAGDAAAVGNNFFGTAGSAPDATLIGMRLISGPITDLTIANAFLHRKDVIDIKSNSWGYDPYISAGNLAFQALANGTATGRGGKGTIYLFAAGNDGDIGDNSNYGSYQSSIYTLCIGGSDSKGDIAYYSEPGANVLCVAPTGGDVGTLNKTTTDRSGSLGYNEQQGLEGSFTDTFNGTSSATPTAAGVVALILEKNPNLGWRDVKEILIRTSAKITEGTLLDIDADYEENGAGFFFSHYFGAGLIDAKAAVNLAGTWTNLGPMVSKSFAPAAGVSAIPDGSAAGVTKTFDLSAVKMRVEHATLRVKLQHPVRGQLAINLISPSGTVSRLAVPNPADGGSGIDWTYSTVHNWGENAAGTWRAVFIDSVNGGEGNITNVSLTVHGVSTEKVNPVPTVQITSPANLASFTQGSAVTLTANASDVDADNVPEAITKVEFVDNGVVVGSDDTAPYSLTYNPANGYHSIRAIATNANGISNTSSQITISLLNQSPTITAASLNKSGVIESDQSVSVIGVTTTDPENDPIKLTYQWERSSDGDYYYLTGKSSTSPTLAANKSNVGYLWRCIVTATDSAGNKATFRTESINIVAKPPTSVAAGRAFSFKSGLVLRRSDDLFTRQAIINEFSQGSRISDGSNDEWVEILVLKTGSLRGWSLGNASGNRLYFAENKVWDVVPAGTVIVIYNSSVPKDPRIPATTTKATDSKRLVLASNNSTYFTRGTFWPSYDNDGDAVSLRDPSGKVIQSFCYGKNVSVTPHLTYVGPGETVFFNSDEEDDVDLASSWSLAAASSTATTGYQLPLLPVVQSGPWIDAGVGTLYDGIETYYSDLKGFGGGDGSARFNSSGATIAYGFNGFPSTLSYSIVGIGSLPLSTQGTFTVMESPNGRDFTAVSVHTNKNYSVERVQVALDPNTRFVQFVYTTQASGAILIDDIRILGDNQIILTATPTTFVETAGANASTATIRLDEPLETATTFTLTSDNPAVTVPATITGALGATTLTFPVSVTDDAISNGTRTVRVTASAPNFTSGEVVFTVTDNETSIDLVTPGSGNNPDNLAWVTALQNDTYFPALVYSLGSGSVLPPGLTLNPNTGVISGTVPKTAANGDYPVTVVVTNGISEQASHSFVLKVTGGTNTVTLTARNAKAKSAKSTQPASGISGTDSDGDGLGDLLELYLGGNPDGIDAASIAPVVETSDTALSITYTRVNKSAESLQAYVEWSTSLLNGPWSTEGVAEEVLESSPQWTKIRASIPLIPGEAPKYIRLRVEPKP